MNRTAGADLASMLAAKLQPAIEEYQLQVVALDATEALIIGPTYALRFTADRDELDVTYIERDPRGWLAAYTLRPLVMQRFTQADRGQYGNPTTIHERLGASVNVYASGLINRGRDILSGDKSWLKRDSWNAGTLGANVQNALAGLPTVGKQAT